MRRSKLLNAPVPDFGLLGDGDSEPPLFSFSGSPIASSQPTERLAATKLPDSPRSQLSESFRSNESKERTESEDILLTGIIKNDGDDIGPSSSTASAKRTRKKEKRTRFNSIVSNDGKDGGTRIVETIPPLPDHAPHRGNGNPGPAKGQPSHGWPGPGEVNESISSDAAWPSQPIPMMHPSPPLAPPSNFCGCHNIGSCCNGGRSPDVGRSAQLEAQVAQLEAQVQLLKSRNMELQVELNHAHQQLSEAWRRAEQMVPGTAAIGNEPHRLLIAELDQVRQELYHCRMRYEATEELAKERDSQVSLLRKRAVEDKSRIAQLENELEHQEAARSAVNSKLQTERCRVSELEKELDRLRQIFGNIGNLNAPLLGSPGLSHREIARGSVPYWSADPNKAGAADVAGARLFVAHRQSQPQVHENDELAGICSHDHVQSSYFSNDHKEPEAPSRRFSKDVADLGQTHLPRSNAQVWQRTTLQAPLMALLARSPHPSRDLQDHVSENFKGLLASCQGPLYEDQYVAFEFNLDSMPAMCGSSHRSVEPSRSLSCFLRNHGTQPVHKVCLSVLDAGRGAPFSLRLNLEDDTSSMAPASRRGTRASTEALWPQEHLTYHGTFSSFAPFDGSPVVELSYLLPDNLTCRVRFRLPLFVTCFMEAASMPPQRYLELWESPDFEQNEVAALCGVRKDFLDSSANYMYLKCLELGGIFRRIQGLELAFGSFSLAASHILVRGSSGAGGEGMVPAATAVLVRAELGGARGDSAICRIAVRAASRPCAQGVSQVFVCALSDESSSKPSAPYSVAQGGR